jgi:hypothetical protein
MISATPSKSDLGQAYGKVIPARRLPHGYACLRNKNDVFPLERVGSRLDLSSLEKTSCAVVSSCFFFSVNS